jgi:hypothetical protein
MNKPSESIKKETNLVIEEEQQQVKKPTKNSLKDFFSKSQANQSNNNKPAVVEAAAAATTATTSIVAEEIKIVNRQLSNTILEETGSLAFMNMKSNETDEKLPNYLFGDLAMIIELNNLLCKLYGIAYKIEENLMDYIGITEYIFRNILLYGQIKLETFKLCQKPLIFKKLNSLISMQDITGTIISFNFLGNYKKHKSLCGGILSIVSVIGAIYFG